MPTNTKTLNFQDIVNFVELSASQDEINRLCSAIKYRQKRNIQSAKRQFGPGSLVEWTSKYGAVYQGLVTKLGRSTAYVTTDSGMRWRVTASLLRSRVKKMPGSGTGI